MTRIREESAALGTREGVRTGLAATGGVITSAGLVLAGTFAVLGTLPVVAFAEIGFAVAFGVLLDTFVVRSVLVSAIALDLGERIWLPSHLARASVSDPPARTPLPLAVRPSPAARWGLVAQFPAPLGVGAPCRWRCLLSRLAGGARSSPRP